MIALLLALTLDATDNPDAPPCFLEATVYHLAATAPAATIRVSYLTEACGWAPPVVKTETADVGEPVDESSTDEPPDYRCKGQEPRTGPKDPCEDGCPCLAWYVRVYGKPAPHFVQVWGPDGEGYADLVVYLTRNTPDGKYRKMPGE